MLDQKENYSMREAADRRQRDDYPGSRSEHSHRFSTWTRGERDSRGQGHGESRSGGGSHQI